MNTRTHSCPGGCEQQIRYERFACRACWYRLPKIYRDAIWRWYRVDTEKHRQAMFAAMAWYAAH